MNSPGSARGALCCRSLAYPVVDMSEECRESWYQQGCQGGNMEACVMVAP